jgi:hypothetical protein
VAVRSAVDVQAGSPRSGHRDRSLLLRHRLPRPARAHLPFFAAAGLCFANVAYGWFVLPESRPGDRTTPLTLRLANPVAAIAVVLRRPVLGRLAYARLGADIARMIHQSSRAFFLTYRFGWSTVHIGAVIAAGALAGAVFQARAVGPIVRRLGDRRAAVAGSLLGAAPTGGHSAEFSRSPVVMAYMASSSTSASARKSTGS